MTRIIVAPACQRWRNRTERQEKSDQRPVFAGLPFRQARGEFTFWLHEQLSRLTMQECEPAHIG
jgi:hypothetical protein